eukprot:snap_masked-scaffold_51-processed-gene-1.15-mRNA-1 protein AED:1.00 eAED:1.00 QI:0/0/0/0/1/1/2/0/64
MKICLCESRIIAKHTCTLVLKAISFRKHIAYITSYFFFTINWQEISKSYNLSIIRIVVQNSGIE